MRQRIIQEIARSVVAAGGVENVLSSLIEAISRGTGALGCALIVLGPEGERPTFISHGDISFLQRENLLAREALEQAKKGNPLFIWDLASDPRVPCREEAVVEGAGSLVVLPLRASRGVRGIMVLPFADRLKLDREELDFLYSLADLGGMILEKAETEDRLMRDAEEARRDLARIRDERRHFLGFLSMVTHDLKSPLVAVQGYLKMLLRKASDELDERLVHGIRRSIQRIDGMLELISDLLELSRLESGQVIREFKEVDWEEVLGAAIEMTHELAEPKGISVISDIHRPLPRVFASDIRLQQLILNLVSNSVRFTPRGGTITIRARREEDHVVVEVEDTGSGIEAAKLPHVFREFYKGDPESPEGTGLGLSICKRIVDMHNGTIGVVSPVPETGRGTRVAFSIPVGVYCRMEDRWKLETSDTGRSPGPAGGKPPW